MIKNFSEVYRSLQVDMLFRQVYNKLIPDFFLLDAELDIVVWKRFSRRQEMRI